MSPKPRSMTQAPSGIRLVMLRVVDSSFWVGLPMSLVSTKSTQSASSSASDPVTFSGCRLGKFSRQCVSIAPMPTTSASSTSTSKDAGSRPA